MLLEVTVRRLAFKPDTDDMRDAVSIPFVRGLLAEGATVIVYDPAPMQNACTIFQDTVEYAGDRSGCVVQADWCIVGTEWNEFKNMAPSAFAQRMRRPVLVDGGIICDPDAFSNAAVTLSGAGLCPRRIVSLPSSRHA